MSTTSTTVEIDGFSFDVVGVVHSSSDVVIEDVTFDGRSAIDILDAKVLEKIEMQARDKLSVQFEEDRHRRAA